MQLSMLISFLGLSVHERETVAACLRVVGLRAPRYEITHVLDNARVLIADAEHPPSVQLVLITERLDRTVFVGGTPPQGAYAHVPRPIDPARLLRELDLLVSGQARPLASVVERRPAAAPAQPPAPPPAPTALLVDDSEVALRHLETQLQPYGFICDRALSSQHAGDLLAQRSYDFVFLDVNLGPNSELDGLALCQQIKRAPDLGAITTIAVLVSSHAGPADRVRGTLAGCDAFIGKPVDDAELLRLMQDHDLAPRERKARVAAVPVAEPAVKPQAKPKPRANPQAKSSPA
jgi:CheY-like chemotaxis protein